MAWMDVQESNGNLIVYHTEVSPEAGGRGLAKDLLAAMAAYARKNHLQVTALCPFVFKQFQRHPAEFADIWKQKKDNLT